MKFTTTVLAATVATFCASAASAATYVVESFDNPPFSNGEKGAVESQGFLYDPADTISGQCYNTLCLTQSDQDFITEVTYQEEGTFDFSGFYLNFNGLGSIDPLANIIEISSEDTADTLEFTVNDEVSSIVGLDAVYETSKVMGDIVIGEQLGGTETLTFDSEGYFLILEEGFLNDITMLSFATDLEGTLVADCFLYNTGASGQASISDFNGCTPSSPNPIPVPAAGWLLMAGIGGLAAMRRRKTAA